MRSRHPSAGTAFVYVAPVHGEDFAKLGFSRDPLQRLRSLHARWYDFFDLAAGWLVETDRVQDARSLERQLRRGITAHNAPSPLTVVQAAGGHSEWFRGALPTLAAECRQLEALGHRVHRPLADWLRTRLDAQGDALFQWADASLQALEHAAFIDDHAGAERLCRLLLDTLDAYPALGLALDARVSAATLDWYRHRRG